MVVATPRGLAAIGASLVFPLAGAIAPGAERAVVPYLALVVAAIWLDGKRAGPARYLRLERRMDAVLSARVSNRIGLVLANDGERRLRGRLREEPPPTFGVDAQEFAFDLAPGRSTELAYHATPDARGPDYFRRSWVRLLGPWGLGQAETELPTERPVRVFPNVLALREFDLLEQRGRLNLIGLRRSRLKGLGTEFNSLRDYNDDDYRHIDWKSTARRGKLVVKQFEQERNQAVILCVDVGRAMLAEVDGVSKLDHTLDAALMLMHAAERAGDLVGMLVYSDAVRRYLPPRRHQSSRLLDAAYGVRAEPKASHHARAFSYLSTRWKRRSLMVVFTDAEDERDAAELVSTLGPLARRHLTMLVRVADPKLGELAALPIASGGDLYTRAAALWHRSERKRAEARLLAAGIRTIEAEPTQLTAALVGAYLRVKEQSSI